MKARNDEQTRFWARRQGFRELLLFTGMGAGACSMHCTYCEPAGTRLLTPEPRWKPIESIQVGDQLVGFEQAAPGRNVRFLVGTVTATATRRAPVYRIVTDKGEVRATGDHLWFTAGRRWKRTDRLRPGHEIRWVSSPIDPPDLDDPDYVLGYLAGAAHGDGTFMHYEYRYEHLPNCGRHEFRLAVKDDEFLTRFAAYLDRLGFEYRIRGFNGGPRNRSVHRAIYITGRERLRPFEEAVRTHRPTEAFARGYLAGLFDADGSFDGGNVRIHNQDALILRRAEAALEKIGLQATRYLQQNRVVALTLSSRAEAIRFFAATQPAILRKRKGLFDAALYGVATVQEVIPEGEQEVFSVETTTGTYVSEGFASHNCFLTHRGPRRVMPEQVLRDGINFLREYATGPMRLHFFGYEPTVNWDLIVAAREYAPDIAISMTTNGYLLNDERIQWLNDHDVKVYVYSIDGGPEHNRYRVDWSGRPTWGRVAENLRKLCLTRQVQWLTARASWHPGSDGEDYDLVGRFRALEELGARSIAVVPVTDAPFDEARVEQAYLELGEYYRWGRTPSKYVNELLDRMLRGEENVPQAGDGCGVGTQYWALLPDGRLALCQEYAEKPEGIIGDIYNGITNPLPFLAISDRVHQFHTAVNPYPKETERYACRRCHAYRHCMGVGWCAGWHRQVTGDEMVPPDGYCAHLRGFVSAMRRWAEEHRKRYPWQVGVMGRTWERGTAQVDALHPAEVDVA